MNKKIYASKLQGSVNIPPSKSVCHRAIICACLSGQECKLNNVAFNDDIIASIEGMRACGYDVQKFSDSIVVNARKKSSNAEDNLNFSNAVCAQKNANADNAVIIADNFVTIDCNESGSTLRFLIPLAMQLVNAPLKFIGRGKLGMRPLNAFFEIFDVQGVKYKNNSLLNAEKKLDLEICGKIKSGKFAISGAVSSQFLTGLLFTLPLLEDDSTIEIVDELQSRGYIDLTISALADFGVIVDNHNYKSFSVKGNQKYTAPKEYSIEGDYSAAAFFAVANYLGSNVDIVGLKENSLQGDRTIFDMLEKLKTCRDKFDEKILTIDENKLTCNAKKLSNDNMLKCSKDELVFDGKDCPDIIPVFCVACALTKGRTKIVNIERLRIKECDRIKAVCEGLNLLGGKLVEGKDYIQIEGVLALQGGVVVKSFNDHRIAMLLAIASLSAESSVIIENVECVKKSYPNFFSDFELLGGNVQDV